MAQNLEKTHSEEMMTYEIQKGDTFTSIANSLGVPLPKLFHLNPRTDPRRLQIGQKIQVPKRESPKFQEVFLPFSQVKEEQDKLNILPFDQMIHGWYIRKHMMEPYIIEDKKSHTLSVYQQGKVIFQARTNTGLSGNDYLTKTYTDKKGHLKSGEGNMSTPAGIFTISGIGKYKGAPAFTRANKNGDIPSSIHEFSILDSTNGNRSNGCTRMNPQDLKALALHVRTGTPVYILPEKEGSRFFIRNGELNFSAETPYGGVDESGKKGMKDYSTHTPMVSKEIEIQAKTKEFERRRSYVLGTTSDPLSVGIPDILETKDEATPYGIFVSTIEKIKPSIQKDLGINNDTYNDLARLACSIALQESKFGEARRYKIKQSLGDGVQDYFQAGRRYAREHGLGSGAITAGFTGVLAYASGTPDTEANSKGIAQVKIDGIFAGKNEVVKGLFTKYGIDRVSIEEPEKSALAIMILLASMYVHEVPTLRPQLRSLGLTDIDALIYMNQGKKYEITRSTATPEKNQYLKRIQAGMEKFEILQKEKKVA